MFDGGDGGGEVCRSFSSLLDDDMSCYDENFCPDPLNDLLALPFSSGTTGLPKGVMLTHGSVRANVDQTRFMFHCKLNNQHNSLQLLPMFVTFES